MTADTYSSILGFLQMGTGNDVNTWGQNCNDAVFAVFENAIAGILDVTVSTPSGGLDLTENAPPNGASAAAYAGFNFTGTLTSLQTVSLPNLSKFWFIRNASTGAFNLTMEVLGQPATVIPQNSAWGIGMCDGANNFYYYPLPGTSTTSGRPSVAQCPAGTPWFDTTLGIPIWSNGTAWVNAAGATV
jgi:hypothetical protein